MIFHMGFHEQRVPDLNLLQTCHFNRFSWESENFRDIIFQNYKKRAAQIKGTYRDDGNCNDQKLA